jgi:flavin reductase (DIM6/NTAB) family NADH-FMN oxidoreductase RutF
MSAPLEAVAAADDSPLRIVTAGDAEEPAGCLVGFATQASMHPPRMLVCLSVVNATYRRARRSQVLGVHLVPADRRDLAELFGEQTPDDGADKFAACAWTPGPGGVPLLDGCPDRFAGQVVRWLPLGDHAGALLDPLMGSAGAGVPPLRLRDAGPLHPGHPV